MFKCTLTLERRSYCWFSLDRKTEAGINELLVSEDHEDVCQPWRDRELAHIYIHSSQNCSSSLFFKDYLKYFLAIFSTNCK